MSSSSQPDGSADETSKLGVLVPEDVQKDNRSLVLYRHDGSKRNKLGPETTDRITHGLAMYFWRHPSEIEEVAQSEYVDDPEAFKQRIRHYQDKHLEDTLVVARNLLHSSSRADQQHRHNFNSPSSSGQEKSQESPQIGKESSKRNRLGGIPRVEDAPQDGTVPQQERVQAREEIEKELTQLVQKEIRQHMEVVERRLDDRLSEIEDSKRTSDGDQSANTQ